MHAFLLGAAIVTRHSFEAQVGLFLLTRAFIRQESLLGSCCVSLCVPGCLVDVDADAGRRCTVGLVASAEWLNAWGAAHWQEFASQDYFDVRARWPCLQTGTQADLVAASAATGAWCLRIRSHLHSVVGDRDHYHDPLVTINCEYDGCDEAFGAPAFTQSPGTAAEESERG